MTIYRGTPYVSGEQGPAPAPVAVHREAEPSEVAAPFAILAGYLFMVAGGIPWFAAFLIVATSGLITGLYIALMLASA